MEGILDRVGFFVKNSVDLEGSPEVIGFGSGSVKSRGLFPSQVGFVIDWSGYSGLSGNWLSRHDGELRLRDRCRLDLRWELGCYWR